MRAVVVPVVALVALLGTAVPVQAVPAGPHGLAVSAPAITLVRQRCGEGMKRDKAWQDKAGAWHGRCVPKH